MENKETTTNASQAIDRFVFHVQTSMLNCRHILQHLDDHYGIMPDSVTWNNCGTAEHVSKILQEICEFMGIKVDGK